MTPSPFMKLLLHSKVLNSLFVQSPRPAASRTAVVGICPMSKPAHNAQHASQRHGQTTRSSSNLTQPGQTPPAFRYRANFSVSSVFPPPPPPPPPPPAPLSSAIARRYRCVRPSASSPRSSSSPSSAESG